MPARSRVFSELLAQEGENRSTLGWRPQDNPPPKRRRTGLNSRFDRMIEAMNVTYYSPPSGSSSSRNRSSSSSSYSLPMTPIDPHYDELRFGTLGEDFSVLKMKNHLPEERNDDDQADQFREPLPSWLRQTFSTLHQGHPLRLLLPRSSSNPQMESTTFEGNHQTDNSPRIEEENMFPCSSASCPPLSSTRLLREEHLASPIAIRAIEYEVRPKSGHQEQLSATPSNAQDIPFSKPGPASSISASNLPLSHTHLLFALSPRSHTEYYATDSALPPTKTHRENVRNDTPSYAAARFFATPARDISSTSVNHSCSSNFPSPYSFTPQTCSDLFTTPGPVYYTSRPEDESQPSSDSPRQDTSLLDIDTGSLQFHWTPFDIKQPTLDIPARAHNYNSASMAQRACTLPPSSDPDEFTIRDEEALCNTSTRPSLHDQRTARRRRATNAHSSESDSLPMASSSDDCLKIDPTSSVDPFQTEELCPQAESPPCKQLETYAQRTQPDTERPETPCPFRFRLPSLPLPSAAQPSPARGKKPKPLPFLEETRQLRECFDIPNEEQVSTEQGPEQTFLSSPLPPAFAPAPGIYVSPLRDGGIRREPSREDIGTLKSRLLDPLDQVAATAMVYSRFSRETGSLGNRGAEIRDTEQKKAYVYRPARTGDSGVESEAEVGREQQLSQGSTESIESWGDQSCSR